MDECGKIITELNEARLMQNDTEASAKRAAHELLDSFPDSVTWREIAYHMDVRASIEAGLKDVHEGRVFSHEDVKKRFGIQNG